MVGIDGCEGLGVDDGEGEGEDWPAVVEFGVVICGLVIMGDEFVGEFNGLDWAMGSGPCVFGVVGSDVGDEEEEVSQIEGDTIGFGEVDGEAVRVEAADRQRSELVGPIGVAYTSGGGVMGDDENGGGRGICDTNEKETGNVFSVLVEGGIVVACRDGNEFSSNFTWRDT